MNSQALELLSRARTYREFLLVYYDSMKVADPRFSYSSWGRRCGFKTKSFLRDCPLTQESRERLAKRVQAFRARGKADRQVAPSVEDELFKNLDWPLVFAALGTESTGATLQEIEMRTELSEARITVALELMQSRGLIAKQSKRYMPQTTEALLGPGRREYFKSYFARSLESLSLQARRNFAKSDVLFYSLAFSVDHKRMPEFRKRLEALLNEFADECEIPEGTRVARLLCGFHC